MDMNVDRQVARPGAVDSVRTDWTVAEVAELFRLPLHELLFRAHSVHRANFDPAEVQISTLMSIKTGGCPEDCGYCPQSVHFNTGLTPEVLVPLAAVVDAARAAQDRGATRFCMGAAYRNPKPGQLAKITEMVRAVHDLGLETCATLGMLTRDQPLVSKFFVFCNRRLRPRSPGSCRKYQSPPSV